MVGAYFQSLLTVEMFSVRSCCRVGGGWVPGLVREHLLLRVDLCTLNVTRCILVSLRSRA